MQRSWQKSLSLAFQGSRRQIGVAALLLGGFPLLGLSFVLFVILRGDGAYSPMTLAVVVGLCAVLGLSGYAILWKYPKNIEKLRWYLRNIASGELPEKIALLNSEDDIKAIPRASGHCNTCRVKVVTR